MTTYFAHKLSDSVTVISDYTPEPDCGPMPFTGRLLVLLLMSPGWYLFLPLWMPVLPLGYWILLAASGRISWRNVPPPPCPDSRG
jgi:hypothetical protein